MTDTRKAALMDLAAFCTGIIPTELGRWPTASAGFEYAKDLRLLAAKVDRVIEAYGEEADSALGGVDLGYFKNIVENAILGDAVYIIETAAKEREEQDAD
jgi:hypothetical protein